MATELIVRYRVKPDRIAEHEGLIRSVFAQLAETAPAGIRYGAFKQADGVSYVHVAIIAAAENPLDTLPAFKAFIERIKERTEGPPEVTDLTRIGAFGL
jgi:hypothetical protein